MWSVPERLECEVLQKVRYINTLTFTFTFISLADVRTLWLYLSLSVSMLSTMVLRCVTVSTNSRSRLVSSCQSARDFISSIQTIQVSYHRWWLPYQPEVFTGLRFKDIAEHKLGRDRGKCLKVGVKLLCSLSPFHSGCEAPPRVAKWHSLKTEEVETIIIAPSK